MSTPALLRRALALAVVLHSFTLSAASVWFGDKDGLHRIDTATNTVAARLAFEPATAITVNAADGSLWALSHERLAQLSAAGTVQFSVSVRDLGNGLGAPRLLVLNPNDGSVWAGFENRILHLDASGVLRHTLAVRARELAVAQDGSIWILTQSTLQQHDASAALLRSVPLPASQRLKHLALDDAGGVLWLAGEKELVQLSLSSPEQTLLSIVAPETTSAISLDLQTGDLWLLGQHGLFAYGRDGRPRVSRDLRDFSIANPQTLLFDFASQAAWVGHQRGLTRITAAGTLAATFNAAPHVLTIAIGRTPLNITPVVSIVAPSDGALLNDSTPELRVDYDALCGTIPCGFPNTFFSTFTLSALVNGSESGSSFVFDPATGGASFTPAARLPEGLNTFSAQARDSFGRFSETVSASFTVDTIVPSLSNITPASGSVVTTPTISIAGSLDEPGATATLNGQTAGPEFNFTVTLVEGLNTFTLELRDTAGNTTSVPLTYTYEPPNVPPTVAIASPANGASFTAPASFTVTANAVDSDGAIALVTFFLNGVLAGTDSVAPYTLELANLTAGTYTLTAQATDNRAGVVMSDAISVTIGPPNVLPVVQLAGPAPNTRFFPPATFQVTATASDADGTIVKVEFLRNGVVETTVTSAPYAATFANLGAGTYSVTARATDDRGGVTTSAALTVTVLTPSATIDSPVANATIYANNVVVRGRVVAPAYSGVSVNDHTAAVDASGNFAVLVPLTAGVNTLTTTVTMLDGTTATQSVNVTASGAVFPFGVTATPMVGYAPLVSTFTVSNPHTVNATFTFDGFGPFYLPARSSVQLNVTYQAGVYVPNIIIRVGTSGYQQRLVIEARDKAQTDQMLRAIWSGMNDALVAGNKARAMQYLNPAAQEQYGPLFDALSAHMAGIVASYSPLQQVSLTEAVGEYALTRPDGATKRLYLIYFLRDGSGVWRIDGM
ncbi:MAG TPA: Ig-like domain-containing protein [Thermoanaerobaculia bacterium]|nr:Ig-like domain-containing protein [Thermoanaerobaculia bacterium]